MPLFNFTCESGSAEPDLVAVAVADLGNAIAHQRDLHRQSDAKATGAFTVVGLVVAAAAAVLPRLDGFTLGMAIAALVFVVFAGFCLGFVLLPRASRRTSRLPEDIIQAALDRAGDPRRALLEHADEMATLEPITEAKHVLIRFGLRLLAIAFCIAGLTAITVMVVAIV